MALRLLVLGAVTSACLARDLRPLPDVQCPPEKRFRTPGEINPVTHRPYPVAMLYSYQGSGNTFTRTLIERATGAWPARQTASALPHPFNQICIFVSERTRAATAQARRLQLRFGGSSNTHTDCALWMQVCTRAPSQATGTCGWQDCMARTTRGTMFLW